MHLFSPRSFVLLGLGVLPLVPARAQVFGPGAVNGALFGGLIGGAIGGGRHGWQDAAIGASAGLLLGSAADSERTYIDRDPPEAVYAGGYDTYYAQPNYALTSTVVGGVLGGIIGNNSGRRNGWAGAAIGAGLGYLIGSAAERPPARRAYYIERAAPVAQVGPSYSNPAPAVALPPPGPMSGANRLFGRQ